MLCDHPKFFEMPLTRGKYTQTHTKTSGALSKTTSITHDLSRTAKRILQEVSPKSLHQPEGQLEVRLRNDEAYEIQTDFQSFPVRKARP